MSKITLIIFAVIVVVISGFFLFRRQASAPEVSVTPEESVSELPSDSASPTGKPTTKKTPTPKPTVEALTSQEQIWKELGNKPATCQLKGLIQFIQPNLFDNKDSLFTYQGIDSEARLILWKVIPDDDIRIGPNIFNKLPIPNGKSLLTVALPDKPKSNRYELYAQVTYARLVNGGAENYVANCTGKVVVDVPF